MPDPGTRPSVASCSWAPGRLEHLAERKASLRRDRDRDCTRLKPVSALQIYLGVNHAQGVFLAETQLKSSQTGSGTEVTSALLWTFVCKFG